MNKFISLLKYSFINSLGINKLKNKKEKSKIITSIIGGIALIIVITFMYNKLAKMMMDINLPLYYILLLTFIISAAIILYISIYRAPSTLFNVKDFDLLASLPISKGKIISVKVLDLLVTNYILMAGVTIPALVIYYKYVIFSIESLITNLIGFIALPLIPMSIGIFIGYIIYIVASKFKYKNIALVVTNIVIFTSFTLIIYTVEKWGKYFLDKFDGITEILGYIYFPFKYYRNAIGMRSVQDILIYLLVSVLVFIIFIFIIKDGFYKINSRLNIYTKGREISVYNGKKQKILMSLLKSEFLKYISRPTVAFNTIMGPILYILVILLIGFKIFDMYDHFMNVQMISGIVIFTILPITATTISLEGNSFYILKTLPIRPIDIIKSKVLLNLVINALFVITGSILIIIFNLISFKEVILSLFTIIFAITVITFLSIILNMKYYNLKCTSEGAAVNKSMSAIITNIISLAMGGIAYFEVLYKSEIYPMITFLLMSLVLGSILIKYGEKMFKEIN